METIIACFGNPLMQDDGIGNHLYKLLENDDILRKLKIVDMGTSSIDLVSLAEDYEKIVIIDAMIHGKDSGWLSFFELNTKNILIFNKLNPRNGHGISLEHSIQMIHTLYPSKKLYLIGIEPFRISMGLELSEILQNKLKGIHDRILEIIQRIRS